MARPPAALTMDHVLLALLDQKPMHGYELYHELCEFKGISLVWNIKQSLLYAILAKLEAHGLLVSELVEGDNYPPRNDFRLTETGKQALQTWLATPVRRARDIRQEFLAKLMIARRYGTDRAIGLIHLQRQACLEWAAGLDRDFPAASQETADEWLVYSFRKRRVQAILEWLEDCEQQVRHLPTQSQFEK